MIKPNQTPRNYFRFVIRNGNQKVRAKSEESMITQV